MNTTLRVLLVDDEEASFFFLKRLLSRVPQKGFTTDWASTYDDGLKALSENRHDVCLLDHRLGPRTGLDLLREAAAQNIQIPIIILTSSDDPKVDLQAAELGAADFVLKDRMEPVMLERVIRYSVQHAATLKALQKSHERFRLLFETQHGRDFNFRRPWAICRSQQRRLPSSRNESREITGAKLA